MKILGKSKKIYGYLFILCVIGVMISLGAIIWGYTYKDIEQQNIVIKSDIQQDIIVKDNVILGYKYNMLYDYKDKQYSIETDLYKDKISLNKIVIDKEGMFVTFYSLIQDGVYIYDIGLNCIKLFGLLSILTLTMLFFMSFLGYLLERKTKQCKLKN